MSENTYYLFAFYFILFSFTPFVLLLWKKCEEEDRQIEIERAIELAERRERIKPRPCPHCGSHQVQLVDHITSTWVAEYKCRECRREFLLSIVEVKLHG